MMPNSSNAVTALMPFSMAFRPSISPPAFSRALTMPFSSATHRDDTHAVDVAEQDVTRTAHRMAAAQRLSSTWSTCSPLILS